MINTDLSITPFKCPVCGFQLGVYTEVPSTSKSVYRLVVSIWGARWSLIDSCPKCHHMPTNDWLRLLASKELDEADNLPF